MNDKKLCDEDQIKQIIDIISKSQIKNKNNIKLINFIYMVTTVISLISVVYLYENDSNIDYLKRLNELIQMSVIFCFIIFALLSVFRIIYYFIKMINIQNLFFNDMEINSIYDFELYREISHYEKRNIAFVREVFSRTSSHYDTILNIKFVFLSFTSVFSSAGIYGAIYKKVEMLDIMKEIIIYYIAVMIFTFLIFSSINVVHGVKRKKILSVLNYAISIKTKHEELDENKKLRDTIHKSKKELFKELFGN